MITIFSFEKRAHIFIDTPRRIGKTYLLSTLASFLNSFEKNTKIYFLSSNARATTMLKKEIDHVQKIFDYR